MVSMNKEDQRFINNALVDVYDNIMRIEEKSIKKSQFSDITVKELHLIHAIGLGSNKSISEVARLLNLSKGTLTINLNILERKGYLNRIQNKKDRRITNLKLTRKGKLLYRAHDAFHKKLVASFLSGFDDDEVHLIKRAMIKLQGFVKEAEKYSK